MKPLFLGLRTTIYKVGDMEAAKKWYAAVFGKEPYFDEPFYAGFDIGGYELGLQPGETTVAAPSDHVVSYWGVHDIHDTYFHLLESGGLPHEEPTDVGGGIWVASVYDPWKNVIGIIVNPEFDAGRDPEH